VFAQRVYNRGKSVPGGSHDEIIRNEVGFHPRGDFPANDAGHGCAVGRNAEPAAGLSDIYKRACNAGVDKCACIANIDELTCLADFCRSAKRLGKFRTASA
jgi:hypothetical protein